MKKVLLFVSIVGMLMVGCSSKEVKPAPVKEVKESAKVTTKKSSIYDEAPEWFFDPSVAGGIGAVGSAKLGKAGMQFAKTEAMAQARAEIARTMELQVKDMVKTYAETVTNANDEAVGKVSTQVSKQVANQTLSGSTQKGIWITDTDVYVLVVLDETKSRAAVKTAFESSLKTDGVMYQQYLAKKADNDLDSEIDKTFSGVKKSFVREEE